VSARALMLVENLTVPTDRRVWKEATSLRAAGYEVTVICPEGPGFEAGHEVLDGVRVLRHPLPPDTGSRGGIIREYLAALRWERRLAKRVWRERGFDVIHVANPPDLLFLVAWPYQLRHGVRLVYDQHDLAPELYESKFGGRGIFYWLLRLTEWLTYRRADLVLATNESFREIAQRRGRVDPARVRIVRNGPDLDEFNPRPPDPAVRRERPVLAGWVGHVGEQSGLEDLLLALAHVVRDRARPDVHLMLIGGGPALDATRSRARELGVDRHVEFAGPVYGEALVNRLSSCDMGVVPLRDTPHGNRSTAVKAAEYMALGLPVVQYDLVESRRTAGPAAAYATPGDPRALGDAILRLADDPSERARLGELGRRRVIERLAWSRQEPELLRAYRDVLGRS
jgi:glycosyltransferase involved in cell wall biosynthesis